MEKNNTTTQMMTYHQALREWNLGGSSWCIPRKNTKEYQEVQDLRHGRNQQKEQKEREQMEKEDVKPKPLYLRAYYRSQNENVEKLPKRLIVPLADELYSQNPGLRKSYLEKWNKIVDERSFEGLTTKQLEDIYEKDYKKWYDVYSKSVLEKYIREHGYDETLLPKKQLEELADERKYGPKTKKSFLSQMTKLKKRNEGEEQYKRQEKQYEKDFKEWLATQ